jgi:hypothetical protein
MIEDRIKFFPLDISSFRFTRFANQNAGFKTNCKRNLKKILIIYLHAQNKNQILFRHNFDLPPRPTVKGT